jgi:RNA polymerase sigma-70 factor (ECF subfamily)
VADPDRGKFRNFLKTSIRNYLLHQAEHERALKRGGGTPVLPLDFHSAESQFTVEIADSETPERVFDRRWAHALLEQVLDRLRIEMESAGSLDQFERLSPILMGRAGKTSYGELAIRWGTTEAAIKMAVLRLRRKFGKLLRTEVAHTVDDSTQVDDEIRFLLGALES